MKIALMTNNYKPFLGGVPISIERLKNGLEELGHEVTVFAPTYENQVEEQGVFRYRNLLNHFIGGVVLPNPFDPQIEQAFRQGAFDIIHVHHPFLIGNMALYLSRKYQIPLAFTYHTRYEQYLTTYAKWARPLAGYVPLYLKAFLKRCDFVFAPTKGMAEYLMDTCKVPAEKLDILPTGLPNHCYQVPESKCMAVRKQYQAENTPLLLSVSRMAQEKNVDFLIRTIARVKKEYQRPFKLLLVGDGPDKNSYESLCRELDLIDVVHFTGKISNEDIQPYFAAADAFVFASKTETQGIVILEAFAGATPVYALDATGVRDLVIDGVNGRLCAEEEEEFASHILAFLRGKEENADVYKQQSIEGEADCFGLAQKAYETALEYREEAVAIKAIRLYNKIIASYQERKIHNRMRELWKIITTTF